MGGRNKKKKKKDNSSMHLTEIEEAAEIFDRTFIPEILLFWGEHGCEFHRCRLGFDGQGVGESTMETDMFVSYHYLEDIFENKMWDKKHYGQLSISVPGMPIDNCTVKDESLLKIMFRYYVEIARVLQRSYNVRS